MAIMALGDVAELDGRFGDPDPPDLGISSAGGGGCRRRVRCDGAFAAGGGGAGGDGSRGSRLDSDIDSCGV
jgi:hypothetical protein